MDHGIHPPDVVVTLSRTTTGLAGDDPNETTSPLPSAPSSPRGSPTPSSTPSQPRDRRSSSSRNSSTSQNHNNNNNISEDDDLLVPDDERILSPPRQQPPQPQPNMSFQDDEEQDEMAQFLHHQPPPPPPPLHEQEEESTTAIPYASSLLNHQHSLLLGVDQHKQHQHHYGSDETGLAGSATSPSARETPFDEEGVMIPTPTLTTTSSTQGLVLDEKKEIDTSDDERLRTTPRSKDWTTMSTSSTMEPSLDGQPPPRRGSSKDEEDPADVSTRIDTGDYDYDDDSQPPSLAPLDNIHSVSRQDLLSTPTPPPPPSPPPPSSSSPLQRPLWKPVQDPHEEQETNPLLDVMIRTVSSLDMDEEPAAHIHAAAHAPRPASSTVHGTTTTTTTIASHATTTTTIMRTPDQQPLKSPPVLFKTANVDWHLPSHEQDQAVILPRNLSLTPPPLPLPTTRQWEEEEGEEFEENEPTMKPLPTHHRTSMTLPDASEEVRYEPLTPFTASTTSAADELRQQQQQQQSWNQDDEDDDKNRVFGKPKGVGGRHIPKPATLRSISVPVHVLSREDEMKTSHFSSNNNNYHGNDGDHDEPPDTEGTSFVRTWEDRQSPVTLVEERPERALRSVSDIPRSTSMSDWTKYLVNDDQQVKGITDISQWLDQGDVKSAEPRRPLFRQMTPKQDFKLSEKSAAWLQEEFKRRSTIKKEINAAILARSDLRKEGHEITSGDSCLTETTAPAQSIVADAPDDSEEAFATALSNALKALPTSPLSADVAVAAEFSHHSEDDEVAALTTFNNTLKSLKEGLQTIRSEEDDASIPRRLDYESAHGRPLSSGVPSVLSDSPSAPQFGTIDFRQDMLRFANETRNVLHGGNLSSRKSEEEPDPQFRSLAVSLAHGEVEEESTIDVTGVITGSLHRSTISAITDDGSNGSPFDISTTPPLVESLDSYLGISKGDITLSLLNEDNTTSAKSTWANRVRVAIWRARRMRRSSGVLSSVAPSSRGRLSIPAAVGRSRAVGGVRSVQASQESAQFHLMNDEIDEALELFETIIFAYYGYFERSLKAREADPGGHHEDTDFRSFIGAALHNLGILNLLKGEYNQALSYFGRAVENRKGCLGESHSDHVASLVKLATCHYAVNEFAEAHAKFEIALEYARNDSKGITDRMQMAEILNNLGCLAYMCGQPSAASAFYRESMDVQFNLMGQSLYLCSADVGQSISLNLSITRANIGFIKLVTNALPVAVTALENALMEQQLLLTGASASLLATMDHLAVANLLNGEPEKAAMMFGRILDLQRQEYGSQDSRCFVTVDKINMVKSSGTKFEEAVAELRKTFSLPETDVVPPPPPLPPQESNDTRIAPTPRGGLTPAGRPKHQKNKVMKVLTAIRKKK